MGLKLIKIKDNKNKEFIQYERPKTKVERLCLAFMLTCTCYVLLNKIPDINNHLKKNEMTKLYAETVNEFQNKMSKLEEKNIQYRNFSNNNIKVEGFDILVDTLPFKNFATSSETGGNCEGYVVYEILNFMNKKSFELSKYHLNKTDMKIVYGDNTTNEYGANNINYNDLLTQFYDLKSEFYYDKVGLEDKKNERILNDIKLNQDNINSKYEREYYIETSKELKDYGKNQLKIKFSPNILIDKIDHNELIALNFYNSLLKRGHAVLCYGYDIIDDNNIKFYVSDSNFPISEEQDDAIQNDIIDNSYVLFTKDVIKNDWSFIYRPKIGGKDRYINYNSLLPGSQLYVRKII